MSRFAVWLSFNVGSAVYWLTGGSDAALTASLVYTAGALLMHWLTNAFVPRRATGRDGNG